MKHKGTIKVARLVGDKECKNLIAASFYDSKPVYFISNACEKIHWLEKRRKLWHKERGMKVNAPFFRLNIVDEYNNGMGNVDQADQLRLQYRIHYWIRNPKWWWAIFFWVFENSLTNCYVLYRKFHELHERKHLSHYKFIQKIGLAWLKPSSYWPVTASDDQASPSVATITVAESVVA